MSVWLLLALALIVSAIGFYKYVYFISLGYGFSISALGVLMLVLFRETVDPAAIVLCLLLFCYGLRLGGFLLLRELKSTAYNNTMKTEIKDGSSMNFGVKCAIWITCAALYALQVLPVYYRLSNHRGTDFCTLLGAAVMLFGLLFESVADLQKSRAKKKNPRRFCDTGLFKLVRCPNYLGELLFWTGTFLSGITALSGSLQWTLALLGYLGIIYVMFSGARRLELRQDKNYGDDPEYQAYKARVPILLPFLPLYSVKQFKFLVA